ncbi:hypothetical protein COCSADRAFT_29370 [Bipolaris sorokiniana ND90Pr]|uniref:Uncharacterized protein n=1 Tax=Cochliobolus sativus (strain ND90Pr / ATCC 201652) TaxID=665912 RepID=M2R1I1_COCSN|nr:uncharacterized protein COCSADRAFT_29370 [Bipolaris sorokiniana ND90Pr]EMD61099.1 hypothetical protein COCSADRAFT_29370 [Bipolaris sorokiniana ND90Pr]
MPYRWWQIAISYLLQRQTANQGPPLVILSGIVSRTRKPRGSSGNSEVKDEAPPTSQIAMHEGVQAAGSGSLDQTGGCETNELLWPAMPPSVLELGRSPSSGEAKTVQQSRPTSSQTSRRFCKCFNPYDDSNGHFYSVNQLFTQGVWIGYLAPDRHKESFRGLPSFNVLKSNCAKLIAPYPKATQGLVGQIRHAVCRGCVSATSKVFELREVQFYGKSKLVIMPLDGDDEAGVFAIMLPQKHDRSLHGLQSYRPYKMIESENGQDFSNDYEVLTLRNLDSSADVLATALDVLPLPGRTGTAVEVKKRSVSDSNYIYDTSTLSVSSMTDTSKPTTRTLEEGEIREDDVQKDESIKTKRQRSSTTTSRKSDTIEEGKPSDYDRPAYPDTGGFVETSLDCGAQSPVTSTSNLPPRVAKRHLSCETVHPELTKEQADRIYIIWLVKDRDLEYEFVHTIGECKTFVGLLRLLEEDTEAIPSIAEILKRTKTWRLCCSLDGHGGMNKALIAREGKEAAFDRLQTILTEAPFWSMNSHGRVHVELRSLG